MSTITAHHGDSATSLPEGFKLVGEHVEGCFAAKHDDGTTFIVHEGMDSRRKRNGNRGGGTGWHIFRCNDLKCEARMLVRWDVLARFVTRQETP